MAETYFPFDSGAGATVNEAQWTEMAQLWRKTAVANGILNQLNVFGDSSGMQVKVDTGQAWVQGFFYQNDALMTKAIAAADPSNPRIDVVAVRLDLVANTCTVVVLQGTAAASPVAPSLTQTSTRWEIALAHVAVGAGVVTITAGNVTDFRTLGDNVDINATQTLSNKTFVAPVVSSGNLQFTGTSQRITGDMSNATHSNRLMFQNSVANGNTVIGLVPNGTATVSGVNLYNTNDPNNAGFVQVTAAGIITASHTGTGTAPVTLAFSGFASGYTFDQKISVTAAVNDLLVLNASSGSSGQMVTTEYVSNAAQVNWRVGANVVNNNAFEWVPSTTAGGSTFSTAAMSVTSTGLGLGLYPAYKLDVSGQARISGTVGIGAAPSSNIGVYVPVTVTSSGSFATGVYSIAALTATANGDSLIALRAQSNNWNVGTFTGTIGYGLYVDLSTSGATTNYAVYTAGTTQSQFGGVVNFAKTGNAWTTPSAGTSSAYGTFVNAGGTAWVGIDNSSGSGMAHSGGAANALVLHGDAGLVFGAGSAYSGRIDTSGRVMVGAAPASPNYTFNVSNANFLHIRMLSTAAGTQDVGPNMTYAGKDSGGAEYEHVVITARWLNAVTGAASANSYLDFYTMSAGTLAQQVRIDNAGNVTIIRGDLRLGGAAATQQVATWSGTGLIWGGGSTWTDHKWYIGGASKLELDSSGNLIQVGGYYSIGSTPATTGVIRLPNATDIYARNSTNNANIHMIGVDSSNNVIVGDNGISSMIFKTGGSGGTYTFWGASGATCFYLAPSGTTNSSVVQFANITTTASAANAWLDSANSNQLSRSTSSLRYKNLIGDWNIDEARTLVMGLKPIAYTSKAKSDDHNRIFVGFAAEHVAELDSRFVSFDELNRPDGVQYASLVTPLVAIAQDHESRIARLEEMLSKSV